MADGGPVCQDDMSEGGKHIIARMLIPSPEKRSTVDEINIDPWVTQYRFADLDAGSASEADEDIEEVALEGRNPSQERMAATAPASQFQARSSARAPTAGSAPRAV